MSHMRCSYRARNPSMIAPRKAKIDKKSDENLAIKTGGREERSGKCVCVGALNPNHRANSRGGRRKKSQQRIRGPRDARQEVAVRGGPRVALTLTLLALSRLRHAILPLRPLAHPTSHAEIYCWIPEIIDFFRAVSELENFSASHERGRGQAVLVLTRIFFSVAMKPRHQPDNCTSF